MGTPHPDAGSHSAPTAQPLAGSGPTSKEEESPGEQEQEASSEEEAQGARHAPEDHQDEAEWQQDHKGPMHGWGTEKRSRGERPRAFDGQTRSTHTLGGASGPCCSRCGGEEGSSPHKGSALQKHHRREAQEARLTPRMWRGVPIDAREGMRTEVP